ncbi:hypothetical protein HNR67_005330 [Crossiella cryophila]|uniref:Uncharacterized protein n=1 Tax=Crossiella cryophila TaxID=43355 RepID=A0A7W7CDK0_9PSEU|nr:hypothetical protein [Crossiella cryophila]
MHLRVVLARHPADLHPGRRLPAEPGPAGADRLRAGAVRRAAAPAHPAGLGHDRAALPARSAGRLDPSCPRTTRRGPRDAGSADQAGPGRARHRRLRPYATRPEAPVRRPQCPRTPRALRALRRGVRHGRRCAAGLAATRRTRGWAGWARTGCRCSLLA